MATNPRRKSKPISALGDASFDFQSSQQPQVPQTSEGGRFDIKQFLMEQRATSFHDSTLFRAGSSSDPVVLSRGLKKKQLPRMDLGKSSSLSSLGNNAPIVKSSTKLEAGEATGSGYRLYSIENMADSSLHATRSHNHTWQTLRASDLRAECPCKRSDVLDLESCFDAAISYSGGKDNWEGDIRTALIDRDFMAVHANVVALYNPATDMDARLLTAIVFEQKWSDIVMGEVESMLMTSFYEQGNLLRKLRIQYATAFYRLEMHYTNCEADKRRALEAEHCSRATLDQLADSHANAMSLLRQEYDKVISSMKDEMEHERAEADRKMFESKEQIAKMSETMKTLNAIFKQMREDSDKVRTVELKEANQKLDQKCRQLEDDIRRLRPLISQNKSLQERVESQSAQMEAAASQIRELTETLQEKDLIIGNLLHRQEHLLAKQDILQNDKAIPEGDATLALNESGGGSNLCSSCQKSLMDGDDSLDTHNSASGNRNPLMPVISGHVPIARRRDGKRVQCLAYRILLPNLQGRRPTKDISWTLGCIRSILYAKQLDDNICLRMGVSNRLKMPEFVYSWFAPPESQLLDLSSDQRDIVYSQADEARWCLYYGAKLLSRELMEAKIFLSFLDEKHGDDELVFGLFCLRVLDCLSNGELDWSALRHSMSFTAFIDEWDAHFKITGETIRVPKTVWITLHHASLATAVVLAKATADERDAFDAKMKQLAVNSLSVSERPSRVVSFDGKNDGPMIDAYQWLLLMLQEYQEEQAQRRAAVRLMFQTATNATSSSPTPDDTTMSAPTSEMDMEQFRAMLLALNSEVSAGTIATYFRSSYERGDGRVTFDAFMATAESNQFFASCIRLPSPNVLASQYKDPSDKDGGINAPHAKLGSLVAKHYTLYENECKLNLHASPPLTQSLVKHALEELRISLREGRGSCIDGFRALASYQRLLSLQIQDRMVRTELSSTEVMSTVLYRLDKELYSAVDCVRIDHTKRTGGELLLESIRRKISVHRLQRAFRARLLRDQGVPLNMRQLMHGGYGNGKTSYRDRRAIRPTKWLVAVISDLIRSKIEADISPTSEHASQLFVEHIYDHFTKLFGSRWEAEKTIHDVFVNTRSLVSTHPRILLFSQLCGMGASGEDKYYGSPQAFSFINMVLHSGHHQFPVLHNNGGEVYDFCRHDDAVAIIDTFFTTTGVENKERILSRLRELERQSSKPKSSDADMLLLFLLEEWRRYLLDRMNQIKIICCSDNDLMAIEGYLSLDNMVVIFRRAGIEMSEFEIAQVFRRVVQSNYSSLSLMERIVKFAFPMISQEIAIAELEDLVKPQCEEQIFLLLSYWEPYENPCKVVIDELKNIGAKNDVDAAMAQVDTDHRRNSLSRAASINSRLRVANITAAEAETFAEKYNQLCGKMKELTSHLEKIKSEHTPSTNKHEGDSNDTDALLLEVDATATTFRRFLTECTRLRALAKIEIGPIPDKWQNIVAQP